MKYLLLGNESRIIINQLEKLVIKLSDSSSKIVQVPYELDDIIKDYL